ncbi:hypothetical protein FE257_004204 [Aspergillus nanangensis]|uniref:DJ-1/PfpI domain-containing protein n=1 Tax=Aspergillus nanangensis TaxID=2582783 RepID=A0AAD4CRG1_ASPNN|nr:hypothetical protein FE257_004204 [Aspergillus nanangensis]
MTEQEPLRIGLVLFPGFQALDAFGPLDVLNTLSWSHPLTISLLSSSLSPVTTQNPLVPGSTGQKILPTHTFADAPPLDALIVPGGFGTRLVTTPPIQDAIAYVRTVYPSLKYLITVCTGSLLTARTGILDGKQATTNKKAFREIERQFPQVQWVARARWVVDGNIWTASGVSAGIDVALAWVAEVWGEQVADEVARGVEVDRRRDSRDDPFAVVHGV